MAVMWVPMLWLRLCYGSLYEFPDFWYGNLGPLPYRELSSGSVQL